MAEVLHLTRFGNPVLRGPTKRLTKDEIKSDKIQKLVQDMRHTIKVQAYGVGLAATQVGVKVAISVIAIKPTPNRPDLERFNTVIINPEIVKTYGEPKQKWEGCVSCGTGNDILFAKVPRFESVRLRWLDEQCVEHEETVKGFVAHVAQHETDHLNGVLFVDRVTDASTYMMGDEYHKRIVKVRSKKTVGSKPT